MKTLPLVLAILVCQAERSAFGQGPVAPEYCLARIDKQSLRVRAFHANRMEIAPVTVLKTNEKGEKFPASVKAGWRTIEETIVTLPLSVVKGYDTDGKAIDSARLAELLAKEVPVVTIMGEPKKDQLQVIRTGIPILSIPLRLHGHGYYGYGAAPPGPVPAPLFGKTIE